MTISAIIITKNEAANIGRCLKSLAFVDEIIVVDAESTDTTPKIAASYNAQVFTRAWTGYGDQKNFGASKASKDWLLFVDADEEVTAELAQSITQAIEKPTKDFYWLRIVTVFLGSPLYHLFGHNPRLFRRSKGQWTRTPVHEQVQHIDEQVTITLGDIHSDIITNPLLHHSHPTINSYLQKMHRYTSLDAQQMATTNQHRSSRPVSPTIFLPIFLATRQFLKLLIYRQGILDGIPGITWCGLSAYYEYEMGQKYRALKQVS